MVVRPSVQCTLFVARVLKKHGRWMKRNERAVANRPISRARRDRERTDCVPTQFLRGLGHSMFRADERRRRAFLGRTAAATHGDQRNARSVRLGAT